MSVNVQPSPKTTISKDLYQVNFNNSTFHTDRTTIVNIIFCKKTQGKDSTMNFINLLLIFEQQFSTYSERLTNPCGRFFCLVVDIVMPSCSFDESDPLKFISTESLPDSNGLNLNTRLYLDITPPA